MSKKKKSDSINNSTELLQATRKKVYILTSFMTVVLGVIGLWYCQVLFKEYGILALIASLAVMVFLSILFWITLDAILTIFYRRLYLKRRKTIQFDEFIEMMSPIGPLDLEFTRKILHLIKSKLSIPKGRIRPNDSQVDLLFPLSSFERTDVRVLFEYIDIIELLKLNILDDEQEALAIKKEYDLSEYKTIREKIIYLNELKTKLIK